MPRLNFFTQDSDFKLKNKKKISEWIVRTATAEGKNAGEISYIFCSDNYLRQINIDYLNHDYLTDIITFDNSDDEDTIEGDIFISVERVMENAGVFNKTFENELRRVIIHGVLHLIGYKDKSGKDKSLMREKEDHYLNQFT